MTFFALTDLASLVQADVDTATATLVRTLAEGLVVGYTGQHIEQATYTSVLLIHGATVTLPQRPVTAVTTVVVDGVTLTVSDDYVWDGVSPWLTLTSVDSDDATATVTYTAGYAAVPADVAAVALTVATRMYHNSKGVAAESIDDYSVTYTAAAGGLTADEKRILDRYRPRAGSVRPT